MPIRSVLVAALLALASGCGEDVPLGVLPTGRAPDPCATPPDYPAGPYGIEVGDVVAPLAWEGYTTQVTPEPVYVAVDTYFDPQRCRPTGALVVLEVSPPLWMEKQELKEAYAGPWIDLAVETVELVESIAGAKKVMEDPGVTWTVAGDPERLLADEGDPEWAMLVDPCDMRVTLKLPRDAANVPGSSFATVRDAATAMASRAACP